MLALAPEAIVVSLLLIGHGAGAALPPRLNVIGKGACPTASDIARELAPLLPRVAIVALPDAESRNDAIVSESGDEFSVSVAGQEKRFSQRDRPCSERAQLAAVFIAIVLDPPRFPSAPETASPGASTGSSGRAAGRLDFELGPAVQGAPGGSPPTTPVAIGLGARARWGKGVSLSMGLAGLSSSLHYPAADVRALWLPADVGARLMWSSSTWGAGAELSLVLAPVHFRGSGISQPTSTWRVDSGARAAVLARAWPTRNLGLFLSLYGFVFPAPYTFGVADLGEVGNAPHLWIGAQLGVVLNAP